MRVLIDGRYAYESDLEDIEVGDEMILPGSSWSGQWTGIVTALQPDYDGPCKKAIGLSRRRAQVEAEREALDKVRISGWKPGETFSKPCRECGEDREYRIEAVNNLGRPTHVRSRAMRLRCASDWRRPRLRDAFRYFAIDPTL